MATNSIRGGASREVLRKISEAGKIFEAWSNEPWAVAGAAVHVSMICFGEAGRTPRLDAREVEAIRPDLSAGTDITRASRLTENRNACFEGGQKFGAFDVPGALARAWLRLPLNPNGRPNSDVLKPLWNGADLAGRASDTWVIDYGSEQSEQIAAAYEAPFQHLLFHVQPERLRSTLEKNRRFWWLHHRSRPELRAAMSGLARYIGTPIVAKHRLFVWMPTSAWPSNLLDAIARDDDTSFGILHCRMHGVWAFRLGTSLEDRPRYTPSTTFETYPFPDGLTPNLRAADYADDPRAVAIAEAARQLNYLRDAWLNPTDLVVRTPEVVPGYSDRILPRDEAAAKVLKTRTLTNLYNQRPAWLDMAHKALDVAVAAAYGWPADLADDEILERLFALNQQRAAEGR